MVMLPLYHSFLICTAIESPPQEGLPPQGADKAYVILLPEATYVSQKGLFALLMGKNAQIVWITGLSLATETIISIQGACMESASEH